MGASISKDVDLSKNEPLLKFIGKENIVLNDPFWNKFLTYNISTPLNSAEQLTYETRIEPFCQEFLKNNLISGNYGTLIDLFLVRASELQAASNLDGTLFNWQLCNTLFIIRTLLKFFTEILNEEDLTRHIETNGNSGRLENFLGALVSILVDVPVINVTYLVHLEVVLTLLIFLSIPMHQGKRSDPSIIYRIMMKGRHSIHAPLLVKSLLTNFINQEKKPVGFGNEGGNSIVLGIATELWSILTFNRKSNDLQLSDNDNLNSPLAGHSLLLLMVLVHHWTTQNNPYRNSLFSCVNREDNNPMQPTNTSTLFKIDFNLWYTTLCRTVSEDAATLLLYLLLHRNSAFKKYLLSRLDLDQLVIPILKTLYNALNSNSHHIYMSLIILLILSENNIFNKTIHQTKLKNVSWYTERTLTEISLGGLLILVVIRTLQYNMLKMRDKYLHTNCLAALANMSSEFRNLHPYVSQRLVSLFETLAKKYLRLVQSIQNEEKNKETTVNVTENPDMEQDIGVLEEVLRIVLEILNSCLSNQLANNPNLVYTMLYKKNAFESFKGNIVFQDIIHNIDIIIQYFSKLLDDQSQQHEVDTSQVLSVIQQGAKTWPKEKLTKFPELKFKYVEEEQPEEFFIPYVWALVSQHSLLQLTNGTPSLISTVC